MEITCVIPSRLGSSRFFGKPLATINGNPMIIHVAQNAIDAFGKKNVIVLTDSILITNICKKNNISSFLTEMCNNSTERVFKFLDKIPTEIIVEIQGDEPLITSLDLKNFIKEENFPRCMISPLENFQIKDSNICKVVVDDNIKKIYYITRMPLNTGYRHVGVYSYTKTQLKYFKSNRTKIEILEDIHPMKWIELGYQYYCYNINHFTHGVDVLSDIPLVEKYIHKKYD
jgi:3-deoxy-manno-octulosonate cytidylyltransferase (CMP-KDO synthetase)